MKVDCVALVYNKYVNSILLDSECDWFWDQFYKIDCNTLITVNVNNLAIDFRTALLRIMRKINTNRIEDVVKDFGKHFERDIMINFVIVLWWVFEWFLEWNCDRLSNIQVFCTYLEKPQSELLKLFIWADAFVINIQFWSK